MSGTNQPLCDRAEEGMPMLCCAERQILVFAGKKVGLELLQFLVTSRFPVVMVVVSGANDTELVQFLESATVSYTIYESTTQFQLQQSGIKYHWLLNLWSPHILSSETLRLAEHRLNVHPSLVPYCRGNDNAAWTIRDGVPAGVSLIEMGESIDSESVYVQREIAWGFPLRGRELNARLIAESIRLFQDFWPTIFAGSVTPVPQSEGGSYYRRRDTERDRVRDASALHTIGDCLEWILAHDFYPGTTAEIVRGNERYRVTVSIEKITD